MRVRQGILKNGLRYYSLFDNSSWLSCIGVKVGTAHDPIAHCTEHLLCRRSNRHSVQDTQLNYFEKFMGGLDDGPKVETALESTVYGHAMLTRKWHMMDCFELFAKMLLDKTINRRDVSSEKGAVIQEYLQHQNDSVEGRLDRLCLRSVYKTNPALNRVADEEGFIRRLAKKDFYKFVRKYYVPNNMFVVMFGPSFRDVREAAKKYLGDLKPRSVPPLKVSGGEICPRISGVVRADEVLPWLSQYHVSLGFPVEPSYSEDTEALELIARILSWRLILKFRLESRNMERVLYRIPVELEQTFFHGILTVSFAHSSADFVKEVVNGVLCEADSLKKNLVNEEEISVMKFSEESSYRNAFNSESEKLADRIIFAACNGDEELSAFHAYIPRLRAITRERIREVANKYFTDNYALVTISPRELDF